MATAFFAGSFNPFTMGHRDIVERASEIFDHIIIGVGENSTKESSVPAKLRAEDIRHTCPGTTVVVYSGLTAHAAKAHGATVLLRSLRNANDLAYETPIAETNRREFGIETFFLLARPELAHVSSSLVRELAQHGHNVGHLLGATPNN
mgnify:CR=1 FL=1